MSTLELVIDGYKEAVYFTEDKIELEEGEFLSLADGEFSSITDANIHNDCTQAVIYANQEFPGILNDSNAERFGHDLWLTRNHHGAGFWDGDWPEDFGKIMTAFSSGMGEKHAYSNVDGDIDLE